MRVLVTGGSGFLGSHLCQRLVRSGHEVRVLCRPTSDLSALAELPIERVIGDVTDATSIQTAVQGCECVIHAAASLVYFGREHDWQMRVNAAGTRNVVEACRQAGVRRLLHVSSVAAVGIPDDPNHPAKEDFTFNLAGSRLKYHLSKRLAEEEVLDGVARGLDAVIVNPASIFGPYRNGYRGGEMIQKVRRARWLAPYFIGGLCVVHVADVVDGALAALDRGRSGQRYILGGENLTFRAAVERAAAAMHVKRLALPVPPRVTAVFAQVSEPWARWRNRRPRFTYMVSYCSRRFQFYDSSKAMRELGYAPRGFDAILHEYLQLSERQQHAL